DGEFHATYPKGTFQGPSKFIGDVEVEGQVTASTDVVGGGKSLLSHRHTSVQNGSGVSGPPQ
ncbi:MAG: hypothetical protein E7K72_26375, partial [Roseomonas mucosa]|nr:hypothetical protein [Roseomonas mucosa]